MNQITRYLACAITIILSSTVNAALVKYSYTGNPFDNVALESQDPTNVSFEFVLEDSLVTKNGRFSLQILNPSEDNTPFKAGSFGSLVQASGSIQDPNQSRFLTVDFDTDLNGNVSGRWDIRGDFNITKPDTGGHFDFSSFFWTQYNEALHQGFDRDFSFFRNGGHDFSNNNNPGIWKRSLAPVPLPPGVVLFGSVLGLLFLRRIINNFITMAYCYNSSQSLKF